jgi:hypothetical protein
MFKDVDDSMLFGRRVRESEKAEGVSYSSFYHRTKTNTLAMPAALLVQWI